ncbi:MAG: hypothetical protein R2848_08300 [Thermomicrobiales bacterium]
MNVLDGLQNIRERLVENDAETATLATVDLFIKRASLPEAKNATVNSQLQLVRMLMRTPDRTPTSASTTTLFAWKRSSRQAQQMRKRDARPKTQNRSKTKKYYKEQKEREKKASTGA